MQRYSVEDWLRRYSLEPELEVATMGLPQPSPSGPWIAGGSVRRALQGKSIDSDIDYFFPNENSLNQFKDAMGKPTHQNDHVLTWNKNHKVQAIKIKYYDSLDDLINSFDYTICQTGYDGQSFAVGDHTLWDLANKRLVPHRVTYAASTMRRAIKYTSQGFTLCAGAATEIYRQVLENPEAVDLTLEYVD